LLEYEVLTRTQPVDSWKTAARMNRGSSPVSVPACLIAALRTVFSESELGSRLSDLHAPADVAMLVDQLE
jgi:hypothetical protein